MLLPSRVSQTVSQQHESKVQVTRWPTSSEWRRHVWPDQSADSMECWHEQQVLPLSILWQAENTFLAALQLQRVYFWALWRGHKWEASGRACGNCCSPLLCHLTAVAISDLLNCWIFSDDEDMTRPEEPNNANHQEVVYGGLCPLSTLTFFLSYRVLEGWEI